MYTCNVIDICSRSLRNAIISSTRNHVYVMSVFKAKDSEGSINADLTGIQAALTLNTETIANLNII